MARLVRNLDPVMPSKSRPARKEKRVVVVRSRAKVRARLLLVLCAIGCPSLAWADESDDAKGTIVVGLRAHSYLGERGGYAFGGVEALYHPWWPLAFGTYGEVSLASDPMTGDCGYGGYGCDRFATRFGALVRAHVIRRGFVDPWAEVGLGAWTVHGKEYDDSPRDYAGFEISPSLGVDLRLPYVSIGPYGIVWLLGRQREALQGIGAGGHIVLRF